MNKHDCTNLDIKPQKVQSFFAIMYLLSNNRKKITYIVLNTVGGELLPQSVHTLWPP